MKIHYTTGSRDHIVLLCLCAFLWMSTGLVLRAQERQMERARKQYEKYEYINAQQTYLRVVEKGYRSPELFSNLGNSFYFNSQFEEAAKWYGELISSYPDEAGAEYYFRYAQTLKSMGKYEEANTYLARFAEMSGEDLRAQRFREHPDYLERIDFQSGRYEIENSGINTLFTDYGGAFYGDYVVFSSSRDTLLFSKSVHQWNDEAFLDLYLSKYDRETGALQEPEKLGEPVNSKFHESSTVFTADGRTIYFTRNNYTKRRYGLDAEGTNRLKLYRSYKNTNGGWTTPQELPFNSDEYSVAHPALSIDGKELYFSSDRPGGFGQSDLYKVTVNADGSFGEPENLGSEINTEGKETFPFISKKGDLYFSSDGHNGLGGLDVFVTRLDPQTDEEALVVNIGKPVNGPRDDFAFIVDGDTKRGYFSSNREGGKGKDDIYGFLQLEDLRPFCKITLEGIVKDKDTDELLPGAVVTILDNGNNEVTKVTVGEDARYSEKVECNTQYFIRAEMPAYTTLEELVQTPDSTQVVTTDLLMVQKVKTATVGDDLAKVLDLQPIYFDFDAYYIRDDAAVELAKVIDVMEQYPQMKIDVRSHTDSHGDDAYNQWLSQKRAESTVAYMVKNGIARDRLTGKGYGESEPVNDCGNGSNCTKEEYQLNRRSEFIIVK